MSQALVTSRLIPVPHGFSTRAGGVSLGPFASLNLGAAVGDEPAHVQENLRRLALLAGVEPGTIHTVSQVHGDRVVQAQAHGPTASPEADGLWTGEQGRAVGVRTADCVPVLLVDPVGRRVAAVHSGWRGTEAQVAARAVEELNAQGSRPEELLAAIGPCIRACCYQVSAEVADRFEALGDQVVVAQGASVHLDLPLAVRRTLLAAGLQEHRIDTLEHCTCCDQARFFSHRRDGGRTGRHLSFAVCLF